MVFSFGWYFGMARERSSSKPLVEGYENTIERLRIQLGDEVLYGTKVSQQLVTEKELRKQAEISREEMRKMHLKTLNELTKLQMRIDTLIANIPHNGTVVDVPVITVANDSLQKAIRLPFQFYKKDKWLELYGGFDVNAQMSLWLKMQSEIDVYAGIEKKTRKPICIVTTDNPYLETVGVRSFKLDLPKDKKYSVGIQAGYGVVLGDPIKLSPFFGVGLTRSIIKF